MNLYSSNNISINQTSKKKRKILGYFNYLYILPVVIGIVLFTFVPMGVSLFESFTEYQIGLDAEIKFTFQNYIDIFSSSNGGDWNDVSHSLLITFLYAAVTVPLSMVGSYFLALLIHRVSKGQKVITVLLYLPSLIPAIASTLLWAYITTPEGWGYINQILGLFCVGPYTFYSVPATVFPTIIMLSTVGWGSGTIMWLAQLNNIPKELYEAAEIDGAGHTTKLFNITIPMSTSMIFYLLITHIISSLQVFGGFYPLKEAYPASSSQFDFIVVKIYEEVFHGTRGLPYACALSWILFIIIGILTLTIFKTSKWVYYGEEQ